MADAFAVPAFGSTGLAGWDQTASVNQNDRSAATATQRGNLDSGLLSHLSRALYIPRHDGETAHMAIHDISAQYAAATHSLSIGSPLYTAALGVMGKPRSGDGIPVLYDVEANNGGDGEAGLVVAPVRDQESSSQMDNVELYVPTDFLTFRSPE